LVWVSPIRTLVGYYLMGISTLAIPVFMPLDDYIGSKKGKYPYYEFRKRL